MVFSAKPSRYLVVAAFVTMVGGFVSGGNAVAQSGNSGMSLTGTLSREKPTYRPGYRSKTIIIQPNRYGSNDPKFHRHGDFGHSHRHSGPHRH